MKRLILSLVLSITLPFFLGAYEYVYSMPFEAVVKKDNPIRFFFETASPNYSYHVAKPGETPNAIGKKSKSGDTTIIAYFSQTNPEQLEKIERYLTNNTGDLFCIGPSEYFRDDKLYCTEIFSDGKLVGTMFYNDNGVINKQYTIANMKATLRKRIEIYPETGIIKSEEVFDGKKMETHYYNRQGEEVNPVLPTFKGGNEILSQRFSRKFHLPDIFTMNCVEYRIIGEVNEQGEMHVCRLQPMGAISAHNAQGDITDILNDSINVWLQKQQKQWQPGLIDGVPAAMFVEIPLYYSPVYYAKNGEKIDCAKIHRNFHDVHMSDSVICDDYILHQNSSKAPFYARIESNGKATTLYYYRKSDNKQVLTENYFVISPDKVIKFGWKNYTLPKGDTLRYFYVADTIQFAEYHGNDGRIKERYTFYPFKFLYSILKTREIYDIFDRQTMRIEYAKSLFNANTYYDKNNQIIPVIPSVDAENIVINFCKKYLKERSSSMETDILQGVSNLKTNLVLLFSISTTGKIKFINRAAKGGTPIEWKFDYDKSTTSKKDVYNALKASYSPLVEEMLDTLKNTKLSCTPASVNGTPVKVPLTVKLEINSSFFHSRQYDEIIRPITQAYSSLEDVESLTSQALSAYNFTDSLTFRAVSAKDIPILGYDFEVACPNFYYHEAAPSETPNAIGRKAFNGDTLIIAYFSLSEPQRLEKVERWINKSEKQIRSGSFDYYENGRRYCAEIFEQGNLKGANWYNENNVPVIQYTIVQMKSTKRRHFELYPGTNVFKKEEVYDGKNTDIYYYNKNGEKITPLPVAFSAIEQLSERFSREFTLPNNFIMNHFGYHLIGLVNEQGNLIRYKLQLSSNIRAVSYNDSYEDIYSILKDSVSVWLKPLIKRWKPGMVDGVAKPMVFDFPMEYSPIYYANNGDTLGCVRRKMKVMSAHATDTLICDEYFFHLNIPTPFYALVERNGIHATLYYYSTKHSQHVLTENYLVYSPDSVIKDGWQEYILSEKDTLRYFYAADTIQFAEHHDMDGHKIGRFTFFSPNSKIFIYKLKTKETYDADGKPDSFVEYAEFTGKPDVKYGFDQDGAMIPVNQSGNNGRVIPSKDKILAILDNLDSVDVPSKDAEKIIIKYCKQYLKKHPFPRDWKTIQGLSFISTTLKMKFYVSDKGEIIFVEKMGDGIRWHYEYDRTVTNQYLMQNLISKEFSPKLYALMESFNEAELICEPATAKGKPINSTIIVYFNVKRHY